MKTVVAPDYLECGGVYPYSEELANAFTFTSRFDEKVEMFMRDGDRIILPRECVPSPLNGDDRREVGDPVDFAFNFTPRKDQGQVVADSVELLKNDVSHIVQAPTGYGKTFVGAAIAAKMGRRVCVITTKEDILGQWAKAFEEIAGCTVGFWRGDSVPPASTPVVVALVHSAMKGYERYSPFAYKGFGLVIVDEVHRMGADMFSKAMWWFPAKLRLGFSATPWRKDGKDAVFQGHIGKVRVSTNMETMIPKIIVKKTGWRVPRSVNKAGKVVQMPHDYGRTILLEKPMAKDEGRLGVVSTFVSRAFLKERNTIVFTETVAHLESIRQKLLTLDVPKESMGFYIGLGNKQYHGNEEQRKAQRDKVKALPIILATYKMVAEATDIPWLDTAVLASPRSDVQQIVGRIRREYPDKKQPVVFDLVDEDSKVLRDYGKARLKWYTKLGCPIVQM